ncbi:wax ester/triacylglycerol synthase family O-acyltransferase [Nocardioides campestrisoli]|uniref:wax ester/triacylglycerol synthase family O-acyltransferase n=1 Tax=Nocardioides campestrisoli TaxID=2736757 RepID=UPI0015E6F267|nr:wax ester/triacylglycerol synthase family O-acyltransferase [Nocardioides campestrisoli]
MRRLSGEDAGFLYMEQPEQPMNSMALGVLEPSVLEPSAALTLADLRAHLERRLDELPSFRWRILPVPLRLHHPVAVDDPDFDLDRHLRHVTLPPGATDADLEALFAEIAEEHLDRDRPLWQVVLVDGLDGGGDGARQAVIAKYHHCLADGVAAIFNFSRIFSDTDFSDTDFSDTGRGPGPAGTAYRPRRLPGPGRLVRDALLDHVRAWPRLPGLVLRTLRGVRAVRARRRTARVEVPGFDAQAPWTPLNDAFTVRRSYVRAELSLAGVKQVKDAAGGTLNDVVLAVVAGALCRYLPARGGLPERPLLTTVPVSTEGTQALSRQWGNHFWSFTTTLATDVSDPWERLAVIGACAREGKARLELLGVGLVPDWLDVLPPLLVEPGARAMLERGRTARESVDASILVSNVRGPAEPWSLRGRVFADLHVDGPPSNGVGVNVMVWSYGDRLLLGCLAFADSLDDPAAFRSALLDSFAELHALAVGQEPVRSLA